MHLCRCEHGHFYDKEKFKYCPHCSSSNYSLEPIDTIQLEDDIQQEYSPIDGEWKILSRIGQGAFGRVYKLVSEKGGLRNILH